MGDVLNIGVSALNAYKTKISTTGHNVANAAREGYKRQTTELLTRNPIFLGGAFLGSGVRTGITKQAVDNIVMDVHRVNLSEEGKWATEEEFASQLNTLLSDTNTGVSNVIENFFGSLQELSDNPASAQQRQVFLSEASNLVKRVNTLDTRFRSMVDDINTQTRETVTEINSLAESLVRVNRDIVVASNFGAFSQPNDLIDERDMLIDRLSELVGITVSRQSDGTADVFIGNGLTLVVGGFKTELSAAINEADSSKLDIVRVDNVNNSQTVVTPSIAGGKLEGLLDFQSRLLDPARATLGRVLLTLGQTINAQHQLGLDGNGEFGRRFFNDINTNELQIARSQPNARNTGTGSMRVVINDIPRPEDGPFTVTGVDTNLVGSGTLTPLVATNLSINNIGIRGTVAGDDVVSSTDNSASAIAIAAALNDSGSVLNLTATAEPNSVYLGTVTAGALAGVALQINGTPIVSLGATVDNLVADINTYNASTGVRAYTDANSTTIILVAEDGRNIQLETDGSGTGTFQHFDTTGGALDLVKRAPVSISLNDTPITVGGFLPGNAGFTTGSTPAAATSLTDSDYLLTYNGTNYTLVRVDDNVLMGTNATPDFNVDGFTLSLGAGTVSAADTFLIKPTVRAAQDLRLEVTRVDKIAAAAPIRVEGNLSNTGTGVINRGKIINTSGSPVTAGSVLGNAFQTAGLMTPPIRIEFFNDSSGNTTMYRVYDVSTDPVGTQIGIDQTFIPQQVNEIFPMRVVQDTTGAGPSYVYDPGYRVSIKGEPQAGDQFNISYNSNALGDNGNALELLKLKNEDLLSNGSSNYQEVYAQLATGVGASTQSVEINFTASEVLRRESEARFQSISGVNLDEEATELLQLQQAFRAAAQVISTASAMFDSLLDAVRR